MSTMENQLSRMTIDVPTTFKNQVKSHSVLIGKKLKDYVVEAIMEKMKRDNKSDDGDNDDGEFSDEEEKYWGELALEAEKEGYIGAERSEALLERMRQCVDKYPSPQE